MLDVGAFKEQLTAVVRQAVEAELANQSQVSTAAAVAAILQKPVLTFPDELQTVLGVKHSTAYSLRQDPTFPKRLKVGAKAFVRTRGGSDNATPPSW